MVARRRVGVRVSRENPPSEWAPGPPTRVPGSPDPGVFWAYVESWGDDDLHRILVWHWHTPTDGEPRWEGAGVGNHTLHSLDPLHLEASLGCHDGCPSHGWIRDGRWQQA
jgi:hypothetical protein